MLNKNFISRLVIATIIGFLMSNIGCDTGTGIEPSLDPGILRITLESNPLDTSIVIVNNTFNISQDDSFGVTIYQGKIYNDENFAFLYMNTRSYQTEKIYNILRNEDTEYKKFIIYESHVPPGDYDVLQFGIMPNPFEIDRIPFPVQIPPDSSALLNLDQKFTVYENRTTEINVQISPFKSVQRYRDTFYFIPNIDIIDVKYF